MHTIVIAGEKMALIEDETYRAVIKEYKINKAFQVLKNEDVTADSMKNI